VVVAGEATEASGTNPVVREESAGVELDAGVEDASGADWQVAMWQELDMIKSRESRKV